MRCLRNSWAGGDACCRSRATKRSFIPAGRYRGLRPNWLAMGAACKRKFARRSRFSGVEESLQVRTRRLRRLRRPGTSVRRARSQPHLCPCVGFGNTPNARRLLESGIVSAWSTKAGINRDTSRSRRPTKHRSSAEDRRLENIQIPSTVAFSSNAAEIEEAMNEPFELLVRQRTEVLCSYQGAPGACQRRTAQPVHHRSTHRICSTAANLKRRWSRKSPAPSAMVRCRC